MSTSLEIFQDPDIFNYLTKQTGTYNKNIKTRTIARGSSRVRPISQESKYLHMYTELFSKFKEVKPEPS